ncbi:MAG TPA: AI-2E family transporter, partial [Candidatus Limnocylindrales bacterium]
RGIGRIPAVLAVVTLVFTLLGLAGWGLAHQMDSLAQDLPRYRGNILAKIADVRVAGQGGTVAKVQATIADITTRLGRSNQPEGTAGRPIVVTSQPTMGLPGLTSWLSPIVGPLGTAGLVAAMVIFMLIERRALRDRLIGFFGQGHLAVTTRAIDEAGQRVSRQLLMQSLVNLIYGVAAGIGLAGWGLAHQMDSLAQDLPRYRGNILAKIADVRVAGQGGSVAKVQATIADITARLGRSNQPEGTAARPIVVTAQPTMGLPGLTSWLSPIVGPLGTAGLVAAMVIFMLIERRALRDRLIGFFGQGHLAVTTRAIDEAGQRVSRQLLMQSLVNLIYGVAAGVGLAVLGVPYALVWATLGAVLRFIPYLGPVLGAGAPILVSLAALQGWAGPLGVVALFVVLELFTNLVLETVLYAGAAGVSQVALLVSLAFWTWLWGPLGLLMATPLTVCLVVLGKHVRGLEFVGALMADTPALAPEYSYYQRLLARDQSEAADLLERHVKTGPARSVYDALLLPALNYAELDRLEQRLSAEEETAIIDATRELLADVAASTRAVS